ncbi:hypothetical protein HDU93_005708 [Gonapodya sp. JEL0774]|nr:hypothetical protein HDU93_005708 [Gonapodya sp. JEL0774]
MSLQQLIEREDPGKRIMMFKALFLELDVSGEGYLDKDELHNYLERLNSKASNQRLSPHLDKVLRNEKQIAYLALELAKAMDTSGDGKVTFDEFEAFALRKEQELYQIFADADANGDGSLSKDEVFVALHKAGLNITKDDVDKFYHVLDRDRNEKLDFYELRDAFFFDADAPDFGSLYTFYQNVYDPTVVIDGLPTNTPPTKSKSLADHAGFFLAGGVAGAISRTLTAPMDRIRTFFQTSAQQQGKGLGGLIRGIADAGSVIYEQEGLRGLWRGNAINVFKVVPESALTFWAFETLKDSIAALEDRKDPSSVGKFVAGGLSGMFSMAVVYPIDTIRTRLMCLSANTHVKPTVATASDQAIPLGVPVHARGYVTTAAPREAPIISVIKDLWRSGIGSFYRGIVPATIGIFPYQAVNLFTFDSSKQFFVDRLAASQGKKHSEVRPNPGILLGRRARQHIHRLTTGLLIVSEKQWGKMA